MVTGTESLCSDSRSKDLHDTKEKVKHLKNCLFQLTLPIAHALILKNNLLLLTQVIEAKPPGLFLPEAGLARPIALS